MNRFGLIGKNLSHSFSKKYFDQRFHDEGVNHLYDLIQLDNLDSFKEVLDMPLLKGLNVTIPYKEKVLRFVDELSDEVRELKATNTLKRLKNGSWKAYNTDVYGFEKSLLNFIPDTNLKALILGSGGASKAVQFVLAKIGVPYTIVSRKPDLLSHINYTQLSKEIIKDNLLIINTTPLGMYPNVDEAPLIPFEFITTQHFLYDLVYNPEETLFLKRGKGRGSSIKNGLEMLHLQAEKAYQIWNTPE